MILVMAGLRRPVEFVAVALTARIGLQLGIVIGGFWLVWYWLRRNSAAMASLNNRTPKETGDARFAVRGTIKIRQGGPRRLGLAGGAGSGDEHKDQRDNGGHDHERYGAQRDASDEFNGILHERR